MEIIKRQIGYNTSKRTGKIGYIVLHDTGNPARGANARSHFTYFNGGDRGSSADFFVDDKEIWQVNDYRSRYSWHCGDGGGRYGISNGNSVGIEICVNQDGDYDKAVANAMWLTKQLMAELSISAERVVRHYDASRKCCPASMTGHNWARWQRFKEDIVQEEAKEEPKMIYDYVDENMPVWARATVQKLMDRDILQGDEQGRLQLDDTMLRLLVIHDRAGLYDRG